MKKIQLGIIGCDSYHTVTLVEQYLKMDGVEIVFVDNTIRGNMNMSLKRQARFEHALKDRVKLEKIDLNNHQAVDLYLILNVDSSEHLNTIKALTQYNKPIFVDKPIFSNMESFDEVKANIMSSSALRFASFMKDVVLSNPIIIEAPIEFVEEVEGYFWYGIHMLEMLQTLSKSSISIESFEDNIVRGTSGAYDFELRGLSESNFKVLTESGVYELESYEDLYHSLAMAILDTQSWQTLDNTKMVIEAVLSINSLMR